MCNRLLMFSCFIVLFGCNHAETATSSAAPVGTNNQAVTKPTSLISIEEVGPFKDFSSFWGYYERHIQLNEAFVGYDQNRKQISKAKFLKMLSTGRYQPILINPTDSIRYRLRSSPKGADHFIADYMKKFGSEELVFYAMEGRPVPKFSFKTIAGNPYTSENTKGKIVLFKCWFIACVPCVQEIPKLNALVDTFRGRKDIVFLSLAMDDQAALKKFLKNTHFDYETIAGQKNYMSDRLKVVAYPTHFLVDKAGNLVKVANSIAELEPFLERLLIQDHKSTTASISSLKPSHTL